MGLTRRTFLTTGAAPLLRAQQSARPEPPAPKIQPALCIFSKHLSKLRYEELGGIVKEMGFDGIDLTVRRGGHVEPAKAQVDFLRAVESIRGEGLDVPMVTTEVTNLNDPMARFVIAVAGSMRIPYYKPGYWQYRPDESVETQLARARMEFAQLIGFSRAYAITCGFHNHAGNYIGASVWDARLLLEGTDPRFAGYYFDAAHATAEGGGGAWENALRMALPRLKMVALQDFYWQKSGGTWKRTMCPLGQGMVDWPKFFAILAEARFNGPISLHLEYNPPDEVSAMVADLAFARKAVEKAYGK